MHAVVLLSPLKLEVSSGPFGSIDFSLPCGAAKICKMNCWRSTEGSVANILGLQLRAGTLKLKF